MLTYQEPDIEEILKDRDGDGITDAIDLQIHLSPSCSNPKILSSLMDLSACLGFETMGMDLPLVRADHKRDLSFHHHLYVGLYDEFQKVGSKENRYDYFLQGKNETDLAETIGKFATKIISRKAKWDKERVLKSEKRKKEFDLLNPFSIYGFYSSAAEISLPMYAPYKIILFSNLDLETAAEAANFAARMGLETLSLDLPLTFSLEDKPAEVKNLIYIGKKEDLDKIGLKKSEYFFNSEWKSGIFLLPTKGRKPDVLICGEGKGLKGILNYLCLIPMGSKGAEAPVFNAIKKYFSELRGFISKKEEKVGIPKKVIREYIIPDEKREIMKILKGGLGIRSQKITSVEIQIFITRPEKARRNIEREIKRWLRQFGIRGDKVKIIVLNAYKPGLSWMKEVVLEEIKGLKIDRIEIAFKDSHTKGLEEPLRWLQEIYPIDEILSERLFLSKNYIEFKKMNRLKQIYRFRAWEKGKVVYEKSFSPKWIAQPYLAPFRRAGKVHPTTGWIEMKVDEKEIIDHRVKTAIERIWEIYQGEIFSLIEKEANKVLPERRRFLSDPVFEELRFDVYFNYPLEPFNVDEERISPLEALHEDFYFITLDFFSNLLKNKGLKNLSLGRTIPLIHPEYQRDGAKFKFKLVHSPKDPLSSCETGEAQIALNGILYNRPKMGINFSIDIEKGHNRRVLEDRLRSFNSSGDKGFRVMKIFREGFLGRRLRIHAVGKDLKAKRKLFRKFITLGDIPEDRPIGYRKGVKLIHSLDGLEGVKVIAEGRSFGGRPLYSLENTYPCQSAFVSHAKRIIFKPTFFINCRHHANEISSTNAGFKLSYLLAKREPYRRLLKRVNVVFNPMENADGMVLLEEMMRDTPTDKLHAARYNGAGWEYYKEYFNPETPFGEARVKPSIWQRWLPDICADNHGFPSHEWDQPFSGYAPYRFRNFWIPRALIFIYLPNLEEKKKSEVRLNAVALGNWLGKNISKDGVIADLNRRYSERYWKYRGQWLAKSSRIQKEVEFLPLQKKFQRTNYSYLHPDITTIDFISEVADEVTWGARLRTCISAHLKTNLAVINLLNNLKLHVKKIWLSNGKNTRFIWVRERPLKFGGTGIMVP
jgi:Zinc carboxypeptidase